MKNKKGHYTKKMLQNKVDEIINRIDSSTGKLQLLESFEETPLELRAELLEGLGSFYDPRMVDYFGLINIEYGPEYAALCQRVLNKYRLAGMETGQENPCPGRFYTAYASCSRHTGRMSLDLAWQKDNGKLYVECIFLTFNADGIHSLFIVEEISTSQYEKDHTMLNDAIEIDYLEACYLISSAYKLNIRYMSRPALGRFLYQRYLDEPLEFSPAQTRALNRKTSARLTPRQLGNSLFYALRYQDYSYLLSILDEQLISGDLFYQFKEAINPGALIMEGQVEEVRAWGENAQLGAFAVILQDREVYKSDYQLDLRKDSQGYWFIANIDLISHRLLDPESVWNPFALQVYCRVYEIIDLDELFDILDQIENIREVEELPYGIHMRLTNHEEDFNHGVSFMTGMIADLIINLDEFVIISQEKEIVDQFHKIFCDNYYLFLMQRGEYEISLASAHKYLSGQYSNFEEILLGDDDDFAYEDGMRFITLRYFIRDRNKVMQKIAQLNAPTINLYDDLQVYYELDQRFEPPNFKAEYILAGNWLTVSAFGERELSIIRQHFEEGIYEALEFSGLEAREEGLFDILDMEVKKHHPDLEATLKEWYLNKWYHSRLHNLRGMSPSEACQTEEGTRLLWSMFKKIRLKETKRPRDGFRYQIGLKEYLRKVDLKK